MDSEWSWLVGRTDETFRNEYSRNSFSPEGFIELLVVQIFSNLPIQEEEESGMDHNYFTVYPSLMDCWIPLVSYFNPSAEDLNSIVGEYFAY